MKMRIESIRDYQKAIINKKSSYSSAWFARLALINLLEHWVYMLEIISSRQVFMTSWIAAILMVMPTSVFAEAQLVVGAKASVQNLANRQTENVKSVIRYTNSQHVVSGKELADIARKIYQNETGGDIDKLIYWNPNEDFASLGIGHAIWFSQGQQSRFTESFPAMIRYIHSQGYPVPDWLMQQLSYGSLWDNKSALDSSKNTDQYKQLQAFLVRTAAYQVAFIADRLERSLPSMTAAASPEKKAIIQNRFATLKATSGGLYPLLDYVNFKGEGVSLSERYNGQGWGLLQVLENMPATPAGSQALRAFAESADVMLTRRVQNAPAGKNEERWLAGWRNRLRTYW
jgi:hypothetical protein